MDRTERFYRIDALLTERGATSLQRLMQDLEVSRATLMRDLAYMRERLHAPIVWDPDAQGYRIDRSLDPLGRYALPGLWFNPSEIHALLAMHRLLQDIEPGLLAPHVRPLAQRLEALLGKTRFPASEILERVRLVPMARRRSAGQSFQTVADALLARRRLVVDHHNRHTGERLARELSPQRLIYYRDNWYLDAWCHLRGDLRSFAVDAIETARALDAQALEVPARSIAERFDAGYGIFSSTAEPQWATLRFNPYKARWVATETWHPDQRAIALPDGGLQLEVPFSDPRELAMDVLRHGGDCEVIAPPSLRALVLEMAQATVARHRH